MYDFEGDQLIIGAVAAGDEEERGIAAVDYLAVYRVEWSARFQIRP